MSNRTYTTDRWRLLKFVTPSGETIVKVLGMWYGGFTRGDEWRLSSGVVHISDDGDNYKMLNHSGSTYICYKEREGYSAYGLSVVEQFRAQGVKFEDLTVQEAEEAIKK